MDLFTIGDFLINDYWELLKNILLIFVSLYSILISYLHLSNRESLIVSIEFIYPKNISELKLFKENSFFQRFYKSKVINIGNSKIIKGRIKTIGKGNPEVKVFREFLSPEIKGLISNQKFIDMDDKVNYSKYEYERSWFTLGKKVTKVINFEIRLSKNINFLGKFVVDTSGPNYIAECKFKRG